MGPARAARIGWALLAASLGLRLVLAWWLPLAVDESYAIAAARQFSWSFFDHPPLGFWLPLASAQVFGAESPLIFRLPFVLLGTATGWVLWRIARAWGEAVGLATLCLFLLAPHMALGSGLLVVPDAPLNTGAALAVWAVLRLGRAGRGRETGPWLVAGLALAVAMASKLQAGLVALAVLGFCLAAGQTRAWLARPGPWLGAVIGLVGLLPVVLWNLQTDWALLRFQAARTGGGLNLANLGAMMAGQAAYLLPPTLVLALWGLIAPPERDEGTRLLRWLAGVQIGFFTLAYAFGRDTLPHWTMTGWLFALPLAAQVLLGRHRRRWLLGIAGFALPLWALVLAFALHLPTGILSRGQDPAPAWDRQTEVLDLTALPGLAKSAGLLEGTASLAAENWRVAGQISTAFQGRYAVAVLGPDQRHFRFHRIPPGPRLLILLRPAGESADLAAEAAGLARAHDLRLLRQDEVSLTRNGQAQIRLGLFLLGD